MTTRVRRSPTANAVPKTSIEQATLALQELPAKLKEELSLREAVDLMRPAITAALSRGYGYEEVAAMLSQKGVEMNAASLKYYMTRVKTGGKASVAKTSTRGKVTRGKAAKVVSAETTATAVVSLPDLMAEVEADDEAPAKAPTSRAASSRGKTGATTKTAARRTTTAAKAKPAANATAKAPTRKTTRSAAKSSTPSRRKKSSASGEG
jgi:hypothetical protein